MKQRTVLRFGLSLVAGIFLIWCGSPANPPPPKWSGENPSASTGDGAKSAASKPAPAKPDSRVSVQPRCVAQRRNRKRADL